jgi:hypothetical protein
MGVVKPNKAHTATLNRVAQRYGGRQAPSEPYDVVTPTMVIEVETTATVAATVARLEQATKPAYVAMTNREGVKEALRLAATSPVGVMDPHGEIVKRAANHDHAPPS